MNVLALTKYSYSGPSSRYRFYNYVECFEKRGLFIEIEPFFSPSYLTKQERVIKLFTVLISYLRRVLKLITLLIRPERYDLVLIEYELLPFFPAVFERLLKKRNIRYIVDYDDAIFHKYDHHGNALVRGILGNKIAQVMQNAEAVVVCNPYLEAYAAKYNKNIVKLPTVVLLERYKSAMLTHEAKAESMPFIIGWIGSKSTSIYVLDILPAMRRFSDAYDVQFRLMGLDESILPDDAKEQVNMEVVPWSEEQEIDEILGFDIGIMPLRDDPWSQGKCGFKLVQYMSCAKPVIASPVGINNILVQEGENGLLAKNEDEWFMAFETLYLDKALREKMAVNNMHKIETEYNHQINCEKYIQMIREVVTKSSESTE